MTPVPTPQAVDAWRSRPGYSWLLKHSRTCPVSAAALAEVEDYARAHSRDAVGLLVVQDARPASDRVSAAFGVKHESPQLFLIRDGKAIWNSSHGAITRGAMELQRLPSL